MDKEKLISELHQSGKSKKARMMALEKLSQTGELKNLDYDYKAAMDSGMVPDKRGHWDNKFKKPSHITFGSDSVHSNPVIQGGEWKKLEQPAKTGEEWQYSPSLYQKLRNPKKEYQEYFNKQESGKGGAILDYPEDEKKPILKNYIISNINKEKKR
jgi:hypothetical protein